VLVLCCWNGSSVKDRVKYTAGMRSVKYYLSENHIAKEILQYFVEDLKEVTEEIVCNKSDYYSTDNNDNKSTCVMKQQEKIKRPAIPDGVRGGRRLLAPRSRSKQVSV